MIEANKMDLTKRIELYFGKSPVKGDDGDMQRCLDDERDFCAVFADTDLPYEIMHRDVDEMMAKYGGDSSFAKEKKSYIRPYLLDTRTGLATMPKELIDKTMIPIEKMEDGLRITSFENRPINADVLRGTNYRVGGMFFDSDIAIQITEELESRGYKIEVMKIGAK